MSDKLYPDALVREGRIFDLVEDIELPSYEGLCLANLAGRWAVMFTTRIDSGRTWELVHWGSTLSTTEIKKFMESKRNVCF